QTHARGAVHQVRDEPTLALVEARAFERGAERQVGECPGRLDPAQQVECQPARGGPFGTGFGVHSNHSPGAGWAPLRQASYAIAGLPSGCTCDGTYRSPRASPARILMR